MPSPDFHNIRENARKRRQQEITDTFVSRAFHWVLIVIGTAMIGLTFWACYKFAMDAVAMWGAV